MEQQQQQRRLGKEREKGKKVDEKEIRLKATTSQQVPRPFSLCVLSPPAHVAPTSSSRKERASSAGGDKEKAVDTLVAGGSAKS